jgi:hypothetical protein
MAIENLKKHLILLPIRFFYFEFWLHIDSIKKGALYLQVFIIFIVPTYVPRRQECRAVIRTQNRHPPLGRLSGRF